MTVVAVMTQPLRAQHCAAFIRRLPASVSIRIITPDERAFATLDLPSEVEFRHPQTKEGSSPPNSISESKLKQRVIRWTRGGSTWGMRFDRAIRSTMRLRYLDRLVTRRNIRRSQHRNLLASFAATTGLLTEMNQAEEISQLVIFDVFDLPPVLEFGKTHSIPVVVR